MNRSETLIQFSGSEKTAALRVMEIASGIDPLRLRRQLRLGGFTIIFTMLGGLALLLTLRYGPPLAPENARFLGFLLFVCVGLFTVAVPATIGPAIEAFVSERLARLKAEEAILEMTEANEQIVSLVSMFLGELMKFPETANRSQCLMNDPNFANLKQMVQP